MSNSNKDVEISQHYSPVDNSQIIAAKFHPGIATSDYILNSVLMLIAGKIADLWVADHYQEVIANLRPEAVATLVAAEAAADISKTLKQDIPSRVREVVKKEVQVYQRGILGGVKRIL